MIQRCFFAIAVGTAVLLGAAGCGSATRPTAATETLTTQHPSAATPSGSNPAATTASNAPLTSQTVASTTTTTATTDVAAPTEVVVVGDSFGRQFFEAAKVLFDIESSVEVRYLISAGPAFVDPDWSGVVNEFVPRPGRAAVLITFGTWQSSPPEGVEDRLAEADLAAEIASYLAPFAALDTPHPPSVLLRPDVADAAVNDRLQRANAATRPVAVAAGLDVYDISPDAASIAGISTVWVRSEDAEPVAYPVRTPLDATHYCPAAALVFVRNGLTRHGISIPAVTERNVADLLTATSGLGLFIEDGCELLNS